MVTSVLDVSLLQEHYQLIKEIFIAGNKLEMYIPLYLLTFV